MKFKSTYFFAFLVIAIGVYTYIFEFKKAEQEKLMETEGVKLLRELPQDQISSIRWQKGTTDFEIEKKEGVWQMLAPFKEVADKYTVETLLTTLTGEKEEILKQEEGAKVDPKGYGFDATAGFIEVKTPTLTKKFIISPQKTFDGRQYHIMLEGKNEIYLASSTFGDLLDKPIRDFRNKEIIGEIVPTKFAVQVDTQPEAAFEKLNGTWVYKANKDLKLNPKAFEEWISALRYVKAHDYMSEAASEAEKKKFGLDKPNLRIRLEDDKSKLELSAAVSKDQKVYILTSRKSIIYEVTAIMIAPLQKTLSDFRDKQYPFTFDEKTVTQLQVEKPGMKVTLEKANDEWKVAANEEKKDIDQAILNSLLTKVRELTADRYLNPQENAKGLAPATERLTFKDQTGKTLLDLALGEKFVEGPERLVYAKTNLSKESLVLKAPKIDELNVDKIFKQKEQAK